MIDPAADREVRFYRAARAAIARTVLMHGSLATTRAAFEILHGVDGTAIFDQALVRPRGGGIMTRGEVIERLCKLQHDVAVHLNQWSNASDCFCRKSGLWGTSGYDDASYRNDGVALEFIEKTVRAAIGKVTP